MSIIFFNTDSMLYAGKKINHTFNLFFAKNGRMTSPFSSRQLLCYALWVHAVVFGKSYNCWCHQKMLGLFFHRMSFIKVFGYHTEEEIWTLYIFVSGTLQFTFPTIVNFYWCCLFCITKKMSKWPLPSLVDKQKHLQKCQY